MWEGSNSRRIAGRAGVLAIALTVMLLLPAAGAQAGAVKVFKFGESAKDARDYWTTKRMRKAVPIDNLIGPAPPRTVAGAAAPEVVGNPVAFPGSAPTEPRAARSSSSRPAPTPLNHAMPARDKIADPSVYPFITHGRIFATIRGIGPYSCSGTVVTGNNESIVMTAGHCVFAIIKKRRGFARRYASNFVFVPGYDEGAEPVGSWAGKTAAIPTPYFKRERITSDFAGVRMEVKSGITLESTVGSRGIAFNFPRNQPDIEAFGYPATPRFGGDTEFTGEFLYRCTSPFDGNDASTRFEGGPKTMRIICDMTGGSSGGGWVIKQGSPECGVAGCIYSVVSYGYDVPAQKNHLYGPYFSKDAKTAWKLVQNNCRGALPTPGMTGTPGPDVITGTPGPDVILGLGGADQINGLGGNDKICGGPGPDNINGAGGRDKLFGDGGGDKLFGGPGRDTCDGGGGSDSGAGCERRKRIP